MAATATYDAVLSRIRIAATALGASATYAKVLRTRTVDNFFPFTTVRGGSAAPVTGGLLNIDDYEFPPGVQVTYQVTSYNASNVQQASFTTANITADLTSVWLKVIARPFLNRPVIIQGRGPIGRKARGGLLDVVGRSYPVCVADVRSSRAFTLSVLTQTPGEHNDIDLLLASGEPVFLHVPSTETKVPSGYFVIGDTDEAPTGRRATRRVFDLPLVEIAAPGVDVVGAAGTWQTVVSTYPNWTAVTAADATWNDVLELVGSPSEVLVP